MKNPFKESNVESSSFAPPVTTDEIQNGGTETIEERVAKLDALVERIIRLNCLIQTERE